MQSGSTARHGRPVILLVDTDFLSALAVKQTVLSAAPSQVEIAGSPEEAIVILSDRPVHLAVIDPDPPDLPWDGLLGRLRLLRIPCVVIEPAMSRALVIAPDQQVQRITQPYQATELAALVKSLLSGLGRDVGF